MCCDFDDDGARREKYHQKYQYYDDGIHREKNQHKYRYYDDGAHREEGSKLYRCQTLFGSLPVLKIFLTFPLSPIDECCFAEHQTRHFQEVNF